MIKQTQIAKIYAIRSKYQIGESVGTDDFETLIRIYGQDPNRYPANVAAIVITKNLYGTIGFTAVLSDDTRDVFSPKNILRRPTIAVNVRSALRTAIRDQIPFMVGKIIHHIIPFEQLVRAWYAEQHLTDRDIEICDVKESKEMTDEEQRQSWQAFHRSNAKYAELTPEEHHKIHSRRNI